MLNANSASTQTDPFAIPADAQLPDVIKYLQNLQEIFAAHIHDGINSQQLVSLALQALTSITIAVRKTAFDDNTPGFWVGLDSSGMVRLSLGNATNGMNWNGKTLTITGNIVAGTIQTATSGQFIRITSAAATSPTQQANSLMLVNSSGHNLLQFGSSASVTMSITPIDNDNQALLIQNDSGLAMGTNLVSIAMTNSLSSGSALTVDQAGSGAAIEITSSTGNAGGASLLDISASGYRSLLNISSGLNSALTVTLFRMQATGISGTADMMRMDNAGKGYGIRLFSTNSGSTNPSLSINNSGPVGRVVEIIDSSSTNTNAVLLVQGNNGAIAPTQLLNVLVAGTSHFWKVMSLNGVNIYASDGALTPNANLSGNNAGDFLIGGPGGHPFYATASGLWIQI